MSQDAKNSKMARSLTRIDSVLWQPAKLALLTITLIGSSIALRVFNEVVVGVSSPRALLDGDTDARLRIAGMFESIASGLTTLGLIAAGLTAVSMVVLTLERGRQPGE